MVKYRKTTDTEEIFDPTRSVWLVKTPEEIVRQNFIDILIKKGYPKEFISVEFGFTLSSGKPQRADIIVYKEKKPYILIECKAESVKITENIFMQVSRYNAVIRAPYVILTNLKTNFVFSTKDFISYSACDSIPEF